jgi:hypothetical protein
MLSGTSLVFSANESTHDYRTVMAFEDDDLQNMVAVYANPYSGKFQLLIDDLEYSEIFTLEIHNTLGEKIYITNGIKYQTSNEIDLTDAQKGLYFVTIYYNNCVRTEKIVIQ